MTVHRERLEIVRTAERLGEIAAAWTRLWTRAGGYVFQSHGWISAWWHAVPDCDRRELKIVVAWRGDTLTAVMALATRRHHGLKVLEWAAKDCSDYGDVLVDPTADPELIQRMWVQLSADGGFDMVYLSRLTPEAAARCLLANTGPGAVPLHLGHRSETSFRVTGSWDSGDAWLQSQSKKFRQNHRRGHKLLGESGDVRFRLIPAGEPLEPVLERIAALKRQWLFKRDIKPSLFEEGAPMLKALIRVLADYGLLRTFVLECDGVIVAVTINFIHRDTLMAFITAYDAAYERASPGMLLITGYIQWAFDQGLSEVDFLCGVENFKDRLANSSAILSSVVGSKTLIGAAAVEFDRISHVLKRRYRQAQA